MIVDATGAVVAAISPTGSISVDTLVATNKKIEFRSSGIFVQSPSAGKLAITATVAGADDITLTGGTTITGTLAVSGLATLSASAAVTGKVTTSVGTQNRATAVTATVGGGTTGIIPDDTSVVTPTSSVSTKAVTLPTPTPGVIVWIAPDAGGSGYNLQSSAPATVAINGGTGALAVTAVGATVTLRCFCASATKWIVTAFASAGTVSAQAPAA